MPNQKPEVYTGDRAYIFVSYAHADEAALQIIGKLVKAGYRVWYDDGVEPSVRYSDHLADHVYGCDCFMPLISSASIASDWCRGEAEYALDLKKKVLPVYLEDVELPRGLQLRMGNKQALFWYKSEDEFYGKLFKARRLEDCLTNEGKSRKGVKAKHNRDVREGANATKLSDAVSGVGEPQDIEPSRKGTDTVGSKDVQPILHVHTVTGQSGDRIGVVRRASLAEYSWAELKELSRAIAAGSDAEGLAIARTYGLADKDGKLQGDEKPLVLRDGTNTSVRILGFRHDGLADDNTAGISFEFADIPARYHMNPTDTNAGGWEESEMRRWLNSAFFDALPDDLRPLVEPAWKLTNNKGKVDSVNDVSVVRRNADVPDRLWLFSMSEVYGKLSEQTENTPWSPATYDAEGTQYQLYADQGVSSASYGFCRKNGARSWWWLRSPSAGNSHSFHGVRYDGDWNWYYSYDDWGVSPGFCF